MTNEYNAELEAEINAEAANADAGQVEQLDENEAADAPAKPAPKRDFKQRSIFVVEDENGVEHEFRSKTEVDAFLAKPRVRKALLAIEGMSAEVAEFVLNNEVAIKAAYAIANPERKQRVISEETREKMRAQMKERMANGGLAKKAETAAE